MSRAFQSRSERKAQEAAAAQAEKDKAELAAKAKWAAERDAEEAKAAKDAAALREVIHFVNGRDGVVNCVAGHVIHPGNRYTADKDGRKTCPEHLRA